MNLSEFFSIIHFKISDAIDIILVAFLLFTLYKWIKGTPAVRIFFGLAILFLLWRLVTVLQLNMLSALIGQFISLGFVSLIVIFQPEIRNFLFYLGENKLIRWFKGKISRLNASETYRQDIEAVVNACKNLASSQTGALIIFAKNAPLDEIISTGEALDAVVSKDLLENIFYKNSPLHDGAIVIKKERIAAARCILPVSKDKSIPSNLGLRHRSAIGATIHSDVIAVLVSEQTGFISYCKEGKIKYNMSPSQLKEVLYDELTR